MAKTKISTLNLRINPSIKAAVREAAAREHRLRRLQRRVNGACGPN